MLSWGVELVGTQQHHPRTLASRANEARRASLDRMEAQERSETSATDTAAELAERQVRRFVDLAKTGDAEAFGHLYDRLQPEILRYLIVRVRDRDVAEDLTQQVFLKAWQAIPRYEHRGAPFRAWLYRMAHNQMVDHFRTSRATTDLDGIDIPEDAEAEERLLTAETNEVLQTALERLSEDHRQVLVLRFLMEKSAKEIGEIMGRKEVTVRGLQMRALQALRREIEETGGMP
ncbi:MAG: sigma-70 family RNA polymerase sigma factor [Dehalococcoidia bacterium]